MNATDAYLVNRGNSEFQDWQNAHWLRAAEMVNFHYFSIDSDGAEVCKHISAIKRVKPDTKPLEDEMRRLLEHSGLVPEARKLIEAALQAQGSSKSEFSI